MYEQAVTLIQNDICFQGINHILKCIQFIYIYSGCDFVSTYYTAEQPTCQTEMQHILKNVYALKEGWS